MRVFNFSAGPSVPPLEVLKEAQKDLLNYNNSGMSVMELSHRSKWYDEINDECISLIRELLNVPEDYHIILVQGGASTQFEAVPLNLLKTGKADYIVTGNFSKKAHEEAKKYGDIKLVASSADKNHTYIPMPSRDEFRADADYLHITENNTIFGTKYPSLPDTDLPIVSDMSSCIMSEVIDVSKYGLIYAGAQKNLSPAGVTLVIVRKDLLSNEMTVCPTMLKYSVHAKSNSIFNTPPVWSIYMMMLNLRYLKKIGGVPAIEKINRKKAQMLYDYIDSTPFYQNNVERSCRSIMNVPFVTGSKELDDKFVNKATEAGLVNIKGHKVVGGMRASIYNAMPIEGIEALIEFMKKFEEENK
ncbi:MAG: 3-phosphoserine/phosphohydroxythreonine transaminase [Clostridia bacterium]|nr:3-phosphoserine/phosphohydroxythreonine transaminase [Clostridia bacterium]